jgi:hypothetical protein
MEKVKVFGEVIAHIVLPDGYNQAAVVDQDGGAKRDVPERYVVIQNGGDGSDSDYTNSRLPLKGALVYAEGKIVRGGLMPVIYVSEVHADASPTVPPDQPLQIEDQLQAHEVSDIVPDWYDHRLSTRIYEMRRQGYNLEKLELGHQQDMCPGRVFLTWRKRN